MRIGRRRRYQERVVKRDGNPASAPAFVRDSTQPKRYNLVHSGSANADQFRRLSRVPQDTVHLDGSNALVWLLTELVNSR
jgi:hypothetical protein